MSVAVASATTMLFVPGDRPERFLKAADSGADVVIIDLEDAVHAERKAEARGNAVTALSGGAATSIKALLRVNGTKSPWFAADLEAVHVILAMQECGLLGIMLPKAESSSELTSVRAALPESMALVPLIESALGIVRSFEIATTPGVTRMAFGAVDYALDVGATDEGGALSYARSALVNASRAAGIHAPVDSPPTAIKDGALIDAAASRGRQFGFTGALCIHPVQVERIRAAHFPRQADIDWARTVVAVAPAGAAQVNGEMIDRPVMDRARRILEKAGLNVQ